MTFFRRLAFEGGEFEQGVGDDFEGGGSPFRTRRHPGEGTRDSLTRPPISFGVALAVASQRAGHSGTTRGRTTRRDLGAGGRYFRPS